MTAIHDDSSWRVKGDWLSDNPQAPAIARRGLLYVLSSPSGAGKTTIGRRIRQEGGLALSISCTTRAPRPGERDGVDYYFIDKPEFMRRAQAGEMLEHAHVFGNLYGTPRAPVMDWLEQGRDVLFDIDWQGARQLRETMGADVASLFILPPSMQALEARLRARGQDSDAVIEKRMQKAANEISHWPEYDYVIINADLERATNEAAAILAAERKRRARQSGLADFAQSLMGEL